MHMKMLVKRGFTVVELLIVVVIIATLAIMTATIYKNAQVQARDAQMRSAADKFADAILLWSSQNRNVKPVGGYGSTTTVTASGCGNGDGGFQDYQHVTINTNYQCTVGDAMVALKLLPAELFTKLPANSVGNTNKQNFHVQTCSNNSNRWVLSYMLEDPTQQDTNNFDAILTGCGMPTSGYAPRDTYNMKGATLIKFK